MPTSPHPTAAAETRGLWLGLLGVAIFAMTLPMTRLAVGPAEAPQLPPLFVTAGRAALAALLSLAFLRLTGAALPPRRLWPALGLCAAGTVIGFPLFLALALREVDAMHAAVVTGLLPLATAAMAALALRQRPSFGFWACALLGSALVLAFAAWAGGGRLSRADGLLLLAILSASGGYVAGATASRELTAEQVICWVLVLSLPLTAAADVAELADAAGQCRGLGRLCLRHAVLDVAGLLRLVPRPGAGRHGARQPGAVAAALPGAAVRGADPGRNAWSRRRCFFHWR